MFSNVFPCPRRGSSASPQGTVAASQTFTGDMLDSTQFHPNVNVIVNVIVNVSDIVNDVVNVWAQMLTFPANR